MRLPRLMLLGAGELGKELAISAKRLGCRVIAVDRYENAPAMQVSDDYEVVDMLDGDALEAVIRRQKPDYVVPEIEAIRTPRLAALEHDGFSIVPSARGVELTMNRDAIRDTAARMGLPTARFTYAASAKELAAAVEDIGLPCVVKPGMSSSGKGQSVLRRRGDIARAWEHARRGMRGDTQRVIVEEFIHFDSEVTLLTVRQRPVVAGKPVAEARRTIFVRPIGHRQERGDYQESWMPCPMSPAALRQAQRIARAITREVAGPGGAGIFGVELFVTGGRVLFSEVSPRPHDTGMVTMVSQDQSQFDLHLRAVLGLPIPEIRYEKAAASAVILAQERSEGPPEYEGLERALALPGVQVRIFGKPSAHRYRRMGVALAAAPTAAAARKLATRAAGLVKVIPVPPVAPATLTRG